MASYSFKDKFILLVIFIFLIVLSGVLVFYFKYKLKSSQVADIPLSQKDTPDLYMGQNIEADQKNLTRGRFVKLEGNSLYLEYYYETATEKPVAKEAIPLAENTVFDCIERYFESGAQKIDRLNMLLDTSNLDGTELPSGKDPSWFKSVAEIGEAVEVRFVQNENVRSTGVVYIYKERCN